MTQKGLIMRTLLPMMDLETKKGSEIIILCLMTGPRGYIRSCDEKSASYTGFRGNKETNSQPVLCVNLEASFDCVGNILVVSKWSISTTHRMYRRVVHTPLVRPPLVTHCVAHSTRISRCSHPSSGHAYTSATVCEE